MYQYVALVAIEEEHATKEEIENILQHGSLYILNYVSHKKVQEKTPVCAPLFEVQFTCDVDLSTCYEDDVAEDIKPIRPLDGDWMGVD